MKFYLRKCKARRESDVQRSARIRIPQDDPVEVYVDGPVFTYNYTPLRLKLNLRLCFSHNLNQRHPLIGKEIIG